MDIEPAPLPLDGDALRAIGVIAVQSARVEWQLAGLRTVVDKSRSHAEHVRQGRASEHVRVIRTFLEENESWAGPEATLETIQWAEEADRLLFRRGEMLHSAWVTSAADGADANLTRRQMKSGNEYPFDQAELGGLGRELGLHAATGYMHMVVATTDLFDSGD